MLKKLLGGWGIVGAGELGEGKIRIKRQRFFKMLQGFLRQQLFRKFAALQNSFRASSDLVVMGTLLLHGRSWEPAPGFQRSGPMPSTLH